MSPVAGVGRMMRRRGGGVSGGGSDDEGRRGRGRGRGSAREEENGIGKEMGTQMEIEMQTSVGAVENSGARRG